MAMADDTIRLHITLPTEWLLENDPYRLQGSIPTQYELDCIAPHLMEHLIQNVMVVPELLRCYTAWEEHRALEDEQNRVQCETRWVLPDIPPDDEVVAWNNVRRIVADFVIEHNPVFEAIVDGLEISMIVEAERNQKENHHAK